MPGASLPWEKILRDSVKDGTIKRTHLNKIPVLKNCTNWKEIEVLGAVQCDSKTVHYDGVMVHHRGKIYYVKGKTWQALQEFLKIKKVEKLKVV